jgi:hypothetical protein
LDIKEGNEMIGLNMPSEATTQPTVLVTTYTYPKGGGEPAASSREIPDDEAPDNRPKETWEYDADGQPVKRTVYHYKWNRPVEISLEYDAEGRVTSIEGSEVLKRTEVRRKDGVIETSGIHGDGSRTTTLKYPAGDPTE